jgi:ferritin-like metal-binding protein YciE
MVEGLMPQKSLSEAFTSELRDTYDAERQLTRALPKMARAATDPELKQAFTNHLRETEGQIERLEQVFGLIEERPRGKRCEGIAGIIEEGAAMMEEDFDESAMDATLIGAGQRAEHYEMAAYGTLVAWAEELGYTEAAGLLQQTLEEEKAADEKLSVIAQDRVNRDAASGNDEGEEDEESAGEEEGQTTKSPARRGRGPRGGARGASRGGTKRSKRR